MATRVPFYVPVAGVVYPKDGNGLTLATGAIDMQTYEAVKFALLLGVANDSASITSINVQQSATTDTGDFAAMNAPWRIGSLTGTDDNSAHTVTVRKEDLSDGKRYVRMVATVSAHSVLIAILAMGFLPIPAGDGWQLAPADHPKPMQN